MNDDNRCPATNRKGERCGHPAGWGTDTGEGPCKFHGGATDGGGAPENNGNASRHNLTADKEKWFKRQDEQTQEDVLDLYEAWLARANDPKGAQSILWDAAVNEVILGDADEYLAEEGFITEQVVGVDDEGTPITKEEEHPALLPRSRMQKDTLRILKDTGVLSAAEDRKADAQESFIGQLAEKVNNE